MRIERQGTKIVMSAVATRATVIDLEGVKLSTVNGILHGLPVLNWNLNDLVISLQNKCRTTDPDW